MNNVYISEELADIVEEHAHMLEERELRRGGVNTPEGSHNKRSKKMHGMDPRQAMIIWAADKVAEEYPEAPQPTVLTLLRAEARVASAVMHSRSGAQVREVIRAAYKRASHPLARSSRCLVKSTHKHPHPAHATTSGCGHEGSLRVSSASGTTP